jgi:hypothetical protein
MRDQEDVDGAAIGGETESVSHDAEEARATSPEPVGPGHSEPSEAENGRRPTPVRAVMEGLGEEEGLEERRRTFRDQESDTEWIVTVSGRSASGVLPLRTVPLLELSFALAEEPGRPLRRALCCGRDLLDLPDHELLSSFGSSEPFKNPLTESDGTGRPIRKSKNRRGRGA